MPSVTERNPNQNEQKSQQVWDEVGPVRSSLARASNLAGSLSTRAKATSSLAKFGIDHVENLSRPIVSTVVTLGILLLRKLTMESTVQSKCFGGMKIF
jgi:hypothetical protein